MKTLEDILSHCSISENGCLEWMGAPNQAGYGKVYDGTRVTYVHRVVYELTHEGCDIRGKLVRHTCDNPRCYNPSHLLLGTPKENTNDMMVRGRGRGQIRGGEGYPKSKLTLEDVREIRRIGNRESRVALGRRFHVSASTISLILLGVTWKDEH